jgi:DNA-binding response OmpR family regulator
VLVVDDDEAIRDLLCAALAAEGYDVGAASDGQEALTCLDQDSTDLVLLDIQMPVMDGPACFAALCQREAPRPKVITIAAATAGLAAAHALGANAALAKPFDLDELLDLVALLLHDTSATSVPA